ncbi:MAG TPA: GNAT family N-acetyltransferase [Thermoanaerobaculia bacterium]|nr:GNAT family N-acetyltransferase [Thermoanaerobaculia bacterium]
MIRALVEADLEAYATLRRQSLLEEPLSFGASPSDDVPLDALRASMGRAPDWMLFGAFDNALVGAAGLLRDRHLKAAHRMHLWGMYVAPSHRHRGLGRALLDACIAHARSVPGVTAIHLGVTSAAAEARRLYESAGFRLWGTQPEALRHEGHAVDEHHMALELRLL